MKTHLPFLIAALASVTDLRANTIVSVQFGGLTTAAPFIPFTGAEPDAVMANTDFETASQWNYVRRDARQGTAFSVPLYTSTGVNTGIQFSTTADGGENLGGSVPTTDIFILNSQYAPSVFTITGLAPSSNFTLFLYGQYYFNSESYTSTNIQVGDASFHSVTGNPSSQYPNFGRDGYITGITSSSGSIQGTWAQTQNGFTPQTWAGFQLDVASAPEPATYVSLGGAIALLGFLRWRRMRMLNSPRDRGASR